MDWFKLSSPEDKPVPEGHSKELEAFKIDIIIPIIITTILSVMISNMFLLPIYSLADWVVTGCFTLTFEDAISVSVSLSLLLTVGVGLNRFLNWYLLKK